MYFKIRAWDKERKIMYYPRSLRFNKRTGELELIDRNTDYCQYGKYEEIVLMVSTGLKDINGKEIYEGDIIQLAPPDDEWKGFVIFKNGAFSIMYQNGDIVPLYDELYDFQGEPYIYVIGNVFENPELLRE